jgi:hypothetical protein
MSVARSGAKKFRVATSLFVVFFYFCCKFLRSQTLRNDRKQYSYTAARGQPIQALANQRTQLQLRHQLARTQSSANGIKIRAFNSQSVVIDREDQAGLSACSFSCLVSELVTSVDHSVQKLVIWTEMTGRESVG